MSQLVLISVDEDGRLVVGPTREPVYALVRHLSTCSDRDGLLGGQDSKSLHAALVVVADLLQSTGGIPVGGWLFQLVARRPWLTNSCVPSLTRLRARHTHTRRTSVVTVLRALAEHMNASHVVEKFRLGPDDLYCVLQFAAEVAQHLPTDLAREARRMASTRIH